MVKFIVMKKLLTLTALIAGVTLFAGCMNQPVEEDVMVEETPVVEDVMVEETPVVEDTIDEEAVVEEDATEEVMPEATAE
jgi:hypothetical protein